MGKICRWCGVFIQDEDYLATHEQSHQDLDLLVGVSQTHPDTEGKEDTEENLTNDCKTFSCNTCQKKYVAESSLLRHQRMDHNTKQFACTKCEKRFSRADSKQRHEKTCSGQIEHICPRCQKHCASSYGLRRHLQWHEKALKQPVPFSAPQSTIKLYRCRHCTETFDNRHVLYLHGRIQHFQQEGGALQPQPWGRDVLPPWDGDENLRQVYEANAAHILENHRRNTIQSVYNFPLTNDVSLNQLMGYVEDIYRQEQRAFRLNIVFGMILQNRETNQYRYFVPYNNNGIFERPFYMSKRSDLQRLRLQLERKDIMTELLRQRPDTKWIPVLVTNVHFVVYSTFYPLGQGKLPDYLLKKDSLYPLVKSQHTGKPYTDNLCAFRSLALHRGHDIRCLEGPAKELYQQWSEEPINTFEGLSIEELPAFETFFNVNVEAYNLTADGFAWSVYKSRGQHETTMYVNVHDNHVSYIRDFAQFAQKYQCKTCDRHFDHAGHLHRHQKVCNNKTKFVYPGGFHQASDSIFEKLDQYEINVPEGERTFPWYMCYDFEALLHKVHDQPTDMLQWTHKHVPISVSICSNVEGYTDPICLVDSDQDNLVAQMVSHMNDIADRVYQLAEEKWGWIFDVIDNKINKDEADEEDIAFEDSSEDEMEEGEARELKKKPCHPLKKVYSQLETYLSQVPVLGFNSAKYDLNLIKRCLAKHLNMHADSGSFVVKKNNTYTCIATESLKFMDMSQFLAPGSSYAGFLKAYHVMEQKGFFPYEWFDDVTKLDATSLPPHEAFYSQLKGSNISEEEYQYCQTVWRMQKMTTFREFLMWYNNLDVQPFVFAVEKFQQFYFKKGIDVFKTAISVPGIARQLLFKTAKIQNANFALFDKQSQDLYESLKCNIIGGPSIIFTRHHCANQTKIRGQKKCKAILGFDANALYLQAIGQPMPVGPFVRRRADNDFRPELRDKYMSAYYWMDWLNRVDGVNIQHKLNTGREVKIGKYPVDGFAPSTNPEDQPTVFQFHGCFWHGHLCDVTRGIRDERWRANRAAKYQTTLETTAYLKREHHVVEIWECQFRRLCRQYPQIYDFINTRRPGFFQNHKSKITEDVILRGVVEETLFGMVEVDIQVPEAWPQYVDHPPKMSPYDYFQEMSPLFCTTDIGFDDIGEHMQAHIWEYQLSDKPRRLLVGGMKARQIMLATPLLKWYLQHGLVVTRIYQVVEFQQQRCFRDFVQEVSDARRQGDVDPDTAIIADTMKVIGNSGYGSLIMDQLKFRNIQYVQGENETCLKVNDPLFTKLECLDQEEQYYEIEMAKRKIKLDLPIQLGYFILQYAKLRMLEFYYDFMDIFVDRQDFEYCEMDTDSAYMAISGSCLEEVIRPEMKDNYQRGLTGFCTDMNIEADAQHHWFPRTCCNKHAKYDKRTPGLFKLEYQGDEMIGLCSKTYIVRKSKVIRPSNQRVMALRLLDRSKKMKSRKRLQSRQVQEYKFSSKGISKRRLTAPMSKFRSVLKSHKAESGLNRGFRVRNNAVFTYTQERRGFSYLYCKRKVLHDGIHTAPLDITLCPLPSHARDIQDQELIDMLVNTFED